jgi:2-methylfumaryl-CoA isomerase
MVVAITRRQGSGLVAALELDAPIARLEAELGLSFAGDEGARFTHREKLLPLVEAALRGLPHAEIAARFDKHSVCWGDYQTLKQALADDARFSESNPLLTQVSHPSGHRYLTPGAAASIPSSERLAAARAPRLGEHTDEVLAQVLGLPGHEIGALHDRGLIAGPPAGRR